MKVALQIQDTPKGIQVSTVWEDNGVTDNMMQSVAMNFAASYALHMRKLSKLNALVIDEINPPPRRGLPRV